ncbi:MAG: hypothetical protein QCH35_07535 [Methanomicrobiaceae archaeon]|nr:hypothetical protein [Methanomicrobiaceae archaeon]
MTIEVIPTRIAGLVAAVVWFVVAGTLYMNPVVAGIYQRLGTSPAVKHWRDTRTWLANTFLHAVLVRCLIFAFVYAFVRPALPGDVVPVAVSFGLILVVVKIIPRFLDMWMQSSYPPNCWASSSSTAPSAVFSSPWCSP